MSEAQLTISFIGGGNMATALIAGLAGQLTAGGNIHVVDPHAASLDKLATQYGVRTAPSLAAGASAVAASDVIVFAVKPQMLRAVAAELRPLLAAGARPLIISIAAGIRGADLARWLGGYAALVRCMPNTPALIGQGITGMVAGPAVDEGQRALAQSVMQAVGATLWLEREEQIDAVTAVSGSGPAYVFYFIEAMQEAALQLGLNAEQGRQLALATFAGASQLAARSPEPVALLRERVTSKGGTTFAALSSMEASGIKGAIATAMQAAAARSRELGDELGKD
jgi:pyrroline-5-carboxylate reductase